MFTSQTKLSKPKKSSEVTQNIQPLAIYLTLPVIITSAVL
ncbi:hypothetical protein AWRI1631_102120 [Saccharomyces cerevisiae AWRI1631]|uniref:Uncharacterized protein n=1 Tax=Saccharomyces cerevisiae (strain AWRI1631) TaxID=545124 RepID=B5VLH7_YEAS6|nr:hypothetical protein AWRI1631_102120 [Saccharomyces cerevisiae AWRI1631]